VTIARVRRRRYPTSFPAAYPSLPPGLKARRSKTLQDLAHWTQDHILDAELAANQLPRRVQTRRKPADKPLHW